MRGAQRAGTDSAGGLAQCGAVAAETKRSQTRHLTPERARQLLANGRREVASHLFAPHFSLCHQGATEEQKIPCAGGGDYESFPEGYGILLRIPGCLCLCLYSVQ